MPGHHKKALNFTIAVSKAQRSMMSCQVAFFAQRFVANSEFAGKFRTEW